MYPARRRGRRLRWLGLLGAGGCLVSCGSAAVPHRPGAPAPSAITAATSGSPSTTSPASTLPPATASGPPACTGATAAAVAGWPLVRKEAAVVAVPVLGAAPAAVAVAEHAGAGAILLLGQLPPAQTIAGSLASLRAGSVHLVMVDEEGGGVSRLSGSVSSLPWPRVMAQTMTLAQVRAEAALVGGQMLGLGVNVDLAPVVDLDAGPALSQSDPDGPRSFSADPARAAAYAEAFAEGLRSAGVVAVAKHFPGLGGSIGNTDYGPAETKPLADLEGAGLLPFRSLVADGIPAVMVSNASIPGLTTQPAVLDAAVVDGLLRTGLGFRGLVVTDSLSAGAVQRAGYDVPAAAVAALRAGADLILFGSTLTPADVARLQPGPLQEEVASVEAAIGSAVASGRLPAGRLDDAVAHVLSAGPGRPCGTST